MANFHEIALRTCAFVVLTNGKNGTIGRQIQFKVLPMVPLVMLLVPNNADKLQQILQTNYSMGKSTNMRKVTQFNMASLKIFNEFRNEAQFLS